MEAREMKIYFEGEAPRIGCGWRRVQIVETERHAYLTEVASGRTQRMDIGVFDQIEEAQERANGL